MNTNNFSEHPKVIGLLGVMRNIDRENLISIHNQICYYYEWYDDVIFNNNQEDMVEAFQSMRQDPWNIIKSVLGNTEPTLGYRFTDAYFRSINDEYLVSFNEEQVVDFIIQQLRFGIPYIITPDFETDKDLWDGLYDNCKDKEEMREKVYSYINQNFRCL